MGLDKDGQPLNRAFNAKRVADRGLDELIGLCKGVVSDGVVNQKEAEHILGWVEANKHIAHKWPCNVIAARIREVLEDGHLDSEEAADLLSLLSETAGHHDCQLGINQPTRLPFDNPLPRVVFEKNGFCLTGKFAFGTRADCQREIHHLYGHVVDKPRKGANYLVVGQFSSRGWIHSTHGRKVEEAVQMKEEGFPIHIIPEDHWAKYLMDEAERVHNFLSSLYNGFYEYVESIASKYGMKIDKYETQSYEVIHDQSSKKNWLFRYKQQTQSASIELNSRETISLCDPSDVEKYRDKIEEVISNGS